MDVNLLERKISAGSRWHFLPLSWERAVVWSVHIIGAGSYQHLGVFVGGVVVGIFRFVIFFSVFASKILRF